MSRGVLMAGVGHYLPDTIVTSKDVERRVLKRTGFRIPPGLLVRVTGVESRHYRADEEHASDLAVQASRRALQRAQLRPSDIDVVVFASCTHDLTEPATANIVADKLAATGAHVLDVKNACNSFLNGLDIAESFVRSGKAETVLVAVGETPSLGINWDLDSVEKLRTGIAGLTLGDAGGAVVLRAAPDSESRGVFPGRFRSYCDKWRLATVLAGGSMHCFDPAYGKFSGKPQALRDLAVNCVPPIVEEVLGLAGWTTDDVDIVCCHQITVDLMKTMADACRLDLGKCVISIDRCGNTAAASIPIGLSTVFDEGRLEPGTKILLVGAAAGFSVGAIPVVW